jgi:hypothetical protein
MTNKEIKEINNTTWVRKTTILTSFALGWLLTIAGFIAPPTGVIDNSVIIILGQALTYTAVGVGLKEYADITLAKFKDKNET